MTKYVNDPDSPLEGSMTAQWRELGEAYGAAWAPLREAMIAFMDGMVQVMEHPADRAQREFRALPWYKRWWELMCR